MSNVTPSNKKTVHPVYLRNVYQLIKLGGADADAALKAVGLHWSTLKASTQYLEFDKLKQLVSIAYKLLHKPWMGLEMGAMFQAPAHGAVGFAIVTSATLRDAVRILTQFSTLRVGYFSFRFTENSQEGVLSLYVHGNPNLDPEILIFYECMLTLMLRLIDSAVGNVFSQMEVQVPFARPAWGERYQSFGIGKLRFEGETMDFHFPKDLLDMACLTADANLCERATKECLQQLNAVDTTPLTTRVREVVADGLKHRGRSAACPDVAEVADHMHVSPRTLIRKLKQEGSSYQTLVDQVRAERAVWLLQHSKETIGEIADRLGFEDASSFSRAFKRWMQISPTDFRVQHEQQAATPPGKLGLSPLA